MGSRRTSRRSGKRIERLADRLRIAMRQEPLLIRLPTQVELAEAGGVSVREAQRALRLLQQEGLIEVMRGGYRAIRGSGQRTPLQQVVLVQSMEGTGGFMQHIALGASDRCRKLGLVMQMRWAEPDQTGQWLEALMSDLPGPHIGWLLGYIGGPDTLKSLPALPENVVLLDYLHPLIPVPSVLLNHGGAARLALRRLQETGHRHIAILTSATGLSRTAYEEIVAQRRWMPGGGDAAWDTPQTDTPRRQGRATEQTFSAWVKRWLDAEQRPTAVLVRNVETALLFLDICRDRGLAVPEQLSVVAVSSEFGPPEDNAAVTLANAGKAADLGGKAVDLLMAAAEQHKSAAIRMTPCLCRPDRTVAPAAAD